MDKVYIVTFGYDAENLEICSIHKTYEGALEAAKAKMQQEDEEGEWQQTIENTWYYQGAFVLIRSLALLN